MRIFKYWLGLWMRSQMQKGKFGMVPGSIDEMVAHRWNHVQALCMLKGRTKLKWRRLFP